MDARAHDVSTTYPGRSPSPAVATLNSTNFAGHTDWRMPNVKGWRAHELPERRPWLSLRPSTLTVTSGFTVLPVAHPSSSATGRLLYAASKPSDAGVLDTGVGGRGASQ